MRKTNLIFLVLSILFFVLAIFVIVNGVNLFNSYDQGNEDEARKAFYTGVTTQIQAAFFLILGFVSIIYYHSLTYKNKMKK